LTAPDTPIPGRPSKRTVAGAIAAMVLFGAWFMVYGHTNPAARECLALYRAASTAAESSRVDVTEPPQTRGRNLERRTCRALTSFGGWWAASR
jgi:hypothetical protein